MTKKKKKLLMYFAAWIILFLLLLVYSVISKGQISQNMAERWSSGKVKYSQISVFYPEGFDKTDSSGISMLESHIDSALTKNFKAESKDARIWNDAYSSVSSKASVQKNTDSKETATVSVTGVGGNFFDFHPLELLSGNYLYDSALRDNQAVLDEDAAWALYSSCDVTGMTFYLNGREFVVQGVVKREKGKNISMVYPKEPAVYIYYNMLSELQLDDTLNCYEVTMPSQVKGYAENLVMSYYGVDVMSQSDEDLAAAKENMVCEIVNNTERYSFVNTVKQLYLSSRSTVATRPIAYPYWENAARITENRLKTVMIFIICFSVYIIAVSAIFLIKKYRHRKWHFSSVTDKLIKRFTYRN